MTHQQAALIYVGALLLIVVFMVVAVRSDAERANAVDRERAAQCPPGTYYSRNESACLSGVRPWEVQP